MLPAWINSTLQAIPFVDMSGFINMMNKSGIEYSQQRLKDLQNKWSKIEKEYNNKDEVLLRKIQALQSNIPVPTAGMRILAQAINKLEAQRKQLRNDVAEAENNYKIAVQEVEDFQNSPQNAESFKAFIKATDDSNKKTYGGKLNEKIQQLSKIEEEL